MVPNRCAFVSARKTRRSKRRQGASSGFGKFANSAFTLQVGNHSNQDWQQIDLAGSCRPDSNPKISNGGSMAIWRSLSLLLLTAFSFAAFAQDQPKSAEPKTQILTWSTLEEESGYLGVQAEEINRGNYTKYGLSEVRGVAVAKVLESSPAATAGLKEGDVILRINGEEVTSVRKLTRLISEIAPDHTARVTIFRDRSEREIAVTLGRRPMPQIGQGIFTPPSKPAPDAPNIEGRLRDYLERIETLPARTMPFSRRQIGVSVISLTDQLSRYFKVNSGVLVSEVSEGSPAQKAGLEAGDIIVEADGKPVKQPDDLVSAINAKTSGEITLTIVRNGKRQTIKTTAEDASPQSGRPGDARRPDVKLQRRPLPLMLDDWAAWGRIV
ncbi:MAG: hypothetical protein C4324_05315 [Blastocatellia bacterium]